MRPRGNSWPGCGPRWATDVLDLAGRRIAITRPEPGPVGVTLERLGATVVHVPLIEIAPPDDGGSALAERLGHLDEYDWLVVTSANGARAVGAAAAASPVRLAVVGDQTGAVLAAAAGRPVDLVADVPRAEGLVAAFPIDGSAVLVAHADRASRTVVDGLRLAGHRVDAVVAYRTLNRAPTAAERAELARADAVIFASGSAIDAWTAAGLPAPPAVMIVAGPVTDAAARRAGFRPTVVAASPGPDGVVAAVLAAFERPSPR